MLRSLIRVSSSRRIAWIFLRKNEEAHHPRENRRGENKRHANTRPTRTAAEKIAINWKQILRDHRTVAWTALDDGGTAIGSPCSKTSLFSPLQARLAASLVLGMKCYRGFIIHKCSIDSTSICIDVQKARQKARRKATHKKATTQERNEETLERLARIS